MTRQRAARAVPRVVVVTTPEQLAGAEGAGAAVTTDGDLVGRGALTRIACDAVIDRVVLGEDGRVLAMDTIGRLATAAQQTALAARDRGCVWPGCTTPPSLCEAHHVIWWSRGGPTTIDNLALLCHRHHTQIHAQPEHDEDAWVMVMRDGVPVVQATRPARPRPPVAAQHLPPDRRRHPPHRPALAHASTADRRVTVTAGCRTSRDGSRARPCGRRLVDEQLVGAQVVGRLAVTAAPYDSSEVSTTMTCPERRAPSSRLARGRRRLGRGRSHVPTDWPSTGPQSGR